MLKNMRANSQAFVVIPDDYEIGFLDMKSSTTKDASLSLAYHSREIMKSVLAQFLELGSTGGGGTGGSRALSDDHSSIFLQSEEAVARWFCDEMNEHIKELVDLNYGDVDKYPTLEFEGISKEDVSGIATTYNTLKNAGAITAQDADEDSFRDKLGLPELDEAGVREDPVEEEDEFGFGKKPPKKEAHEHLKKKHFADQTPGFSTWRKLTFAEKKVDFTSIQDMMEKFEERFDRETKALLHDARDSYIAALTKAANNNDTRGIKDATIKVQSDYARIIKNSLTAAFTFGKNNAAKEIGVEAPANPAEMLRQIDIQADAIAEAQIAQIVGDSKSAYVQALNRGESIAVAIAAADQWADEAIEVLTRDASQILTSGYINHGRSTVFERNGADVYALQRSEILDEATCNYCLDVDSRVIEKDDPFGSNTIFHSSCRGIWVAIMKDEEDPPKIKGIPQATRDRFGDVVNDLIQPKKRKRR